MTIDAYASADHWADHLAPVLAALPKAARGDLLRIAEPGSGPVIVASIGDLGQMRRAGRGPIALMEHGAGQSYGGTLSSAFHPAYAGGKRRTADLFLHPGPHPAARDRAAYPNTPVEIVGSPYLETLPAREPGPGPVIAVTWHADHSLTNETHSAFSWFRRGIVELAQRYQVIGSGHPHILAQLAPWYERHGIEVVPDFRDVCRRADLLVFDNTSTGFFFAATGRPVVVCNAPIYRPAVEHGLRFWEDAAVGVNCNDERGLLDAVAEALEDAPERKQARESAADHVFAFRSGAAKRAAHTLIGWATEQRQPFVSVPARPAASIRPATPEPSGVPRVVLCVPYRADGGRREQTWSFVERQWRRLLPGVRIATGASPNGQWNTSAARNAAAAAAGDWDVAVFVDADTLMRQREPLLKAIEMAHRTGKVVLPHDSYFALTQHGSDLVMRGHEDGYSDLAKTVKRTPLGVAAVPRSAWERLGGFDERFEGWGGEDASFIEASATVIGFTRLSGSIWHLWHLPDPTRAAYARTQGGPLRAAYRAAHGDPEAMQALLDQRRPPLRIIIPAGRTTDERWGGHLGIPKQLVPVPAAMGSEPLIERTVRLLSPHGEVIVIYGDVPLPIDPAIRQEPADNIPDLGDINGIVNSRRLWSTTGRTLIVLGDVYLSEAAARILVTPRSEWALFGRRDRNPLTGKPWDEQYALSFGPADHAAVLAAAKRGSALWHAGLARWVRFPQWYRAMHGVADDKVDLRRLPQPDLGHFVPIEDETDDIDKPEDYEHLMAHLSQLALSSARSAGMDQ